MADYNQNVMVGLSSVAMKAFNFGNSVNTVKLRIRIVLMWCVVQSFNIGAGYVSID